MVSLTVHNLDRGAIQKWKHGGPKLESPSEDHEGLNVYWIPSRVLEHSIEYLNLVFIWVGLLFTISSNLLVHFWIIIDHLTFYEGEDDIIFSFWFWIRIVVITLKFGFLLSDYQSGSWFKNYFHKYFLTCFHSSLLILYVKKWVSKYHNWGCGGYDDILVVIL